MTPQRHPRPGPARRPPRDPKGLHPGDACPRPHWRCRSQGEPQEAVIEIPCLSSEARARLRRWRMIEQRHLNEVISRLAVRRIASSAEAGVQSPSTRERGSQSMRAIRRLRRHGVTSLSRVSGSVFAMAAPVMMATASAGVCDWGDRDPSSKTLDVDTVGDLEHVRHVVTDEDHAESCIPQTGDHVEHLPSRAYRERPSVRRARRSVS